MDMNQCAELQKIYYKIEHRSHRLFTGTHERIRLQYCLLLMAGSAFSVMVSLTNFLLITWCI